MCFHVSRDMVKHMLAITATEHSEVQRVDGDRDKRKEERVCGCLDDSLNEVVCVCVCVYVCVSESERERKSVCLSVNVG